MRLKDYPIYFDTTQIPWPTGWELEYENIQTVNTTEAGTDVVDTSRWHKLTVDAKFLSSSRWAKFFEEYSQKPDFTLKFYSEIAEEYVEVSVRMTGFKRKMKKHSEKVQETLGVWDVSFDLEQF